MNKHVSSLCVRWFSVTVLMAGLVVYAAQAAPLAYIANSGSNTVSVIDTATDSVVATVNVGSEPAGVAVSPDGSRVYVANSCGTSPCNTSNATVSVIDTATDSVVATVNVGYAPFGVAVNPDGSRVYVANECGNSSSCGSNGTVSVIDTATDSVVATVNVGSVPFGVAVSPDGSRVYVVNECGTSTCSSSVNDTVSVIDAANNSVATSVTVGNSPVSVGAFVGPGALIATNSSAAGSVGSQITASVPVLTNTSGCTANDVLVQSPAQGGVVLNSAGAFTYTPSSATYSGPDAFTWQGQAPSACTAADSPTDPVSNTAMVSLTIDPLLAGLTDTMLDESASTQEDFELTGTAPFTLTVASSNTKVLPSAGVTIAPSACGTTESDLSCTLKLSSGNVAGTSDVTVTATDTFGDTVMETKTVTVAAPAPPMSGGGGGALSPLGLLLLAGLVCLEGWTRRRGVRGSRG